MKKQSLLPWATLAFASFSCSADYYISGFGTLAAGQAHGSEEVISQGISGYDDDDWDFDSGSLVGLQGTVDITDNMGATVQGLFEGDDDWDGELTWAYLSYDFTDEWRVIVGRQIMPHYIYSDFINVSYSYHWISVPDQVYNSPFNSFNGISSQYTINFDESSLFTQILYGQEHDEDETGNDYDDIWGGRVSYNYDWLTLYLGYFEFRESSTDSSPAPGGEIVELDESGVLVSYDVGFQVDYDDWLVVAEMTTVNLEDYGSESSKSGTKQPWMLSVAKRIGDFTPYVTYGQDRSLDFNDTDTNTPFYSVGLRWDFYESMALKTEYLHEEDSDESSGEVYQAALVVTF